MNMKKCILFVFFLIPLMSDAQNFIKSYSAYRCWSPNTGTQNAANIATAVYFYDDHIRTFTGNFIYSGRNAEDALIYVTGIFHTIYPNDNYFVGFLSNA